MVLMTTLAVACGGARARPPIASAPAAPQSSIQTMYETGEYEQVVVATAESAAASPLAIWLAGQSYQRLGRPEEARAEFAKLAVEAGAWALVGEIATELLAPDTTRLRRLVGAAARYPSEPFVQYQAAVATMRLEDFAQAASALERSLAADPTFAYTYYLAGLVYDRLGRADLVAARFERFVELAPRAPERPAVESLLRTLRGR
jgi:tetratricopeptide (TPR) repeat protein